MATTRTTTRRKVQTQESRSFTLTLTQGERARAERLADRDDRSLSSLVRLALKDYCERAEGLTRITDRTQEHGTAPPLPHTTFDRTGPA